MSNVTQRVAVVDTNGIVIAVTDIPDGVNVSEMIVTDQVVEVGDTYDDDCFRSKQGNLRF